MKKYVITLCLVILASLNLLAQDICIPDSIARKVVDELIVKDHLQFTVTKQDSIITILNVDLGNKIQEISILKTNEVDYKSITTKLQEVITIREAEIKDLRKQNRQIRFKAVRTAVLEGIAIAGLLFIYMLK